MSGGGNGGTSEGKNEENCRTPAPQLSARQQGTRDGTRGRGGRGMLLGEIPAGSPAGARTGFDCAAAGGPLHGRTEVYHIRCEDTAAGNEMATTGNKSKTALYRRRPEQQRRRPEQQQG